MKKNIVFIILSLLFVLYFSATLYTFQILNGDQYLSHSISNNYSKKLITPQRGIISDRNGNILADNLVDYNILLDSTVFQLSEIQTFVDVLRKDIEFNEYMLGDREISSIEGQLINNVNDRNYLVLKGLSKEAYDKFFNKYGATNGLIGYENWERRYSNPVDFSSVLGYLGVPDENDIQEGRYLINYKKIGKSGVEEYYDKFLMGQSGERIIYESIEGKYDELIVKNQRPGKNIILTIDRDWQLLLAKLLDNQMQKSKSYGAAGVIMEADTGEIRALVSLPGFDASIFNQGYSEDEYRQFLKNPKKPLLNKVISTKVSPGSTIKPILALFALNDEIIDPSYKYYSKGCENLGTNITFCEADRVSLGEVDFAKSIYRSSNLYYCSIAKLYETRYKNQGLQYLLDNFDQVGSTNLVGIDMKGEVGSTLPSFERTQKNYGREWSIGDMCNTFIGQGDLAVTPIKMLSLVSMIANNGKIYQPHIVSRVTSNEGEVIIENLPVEKYNFISRDDSYFELIRKAMKLAVNESVGSASLLKGLDSSLYLKTGSADAKEVLEDGQVLEGAHSWVIGVFEREGKSYSFVIVQYFGGRGYQTVPVIGNFLNCMNKNSEKGCIIY